VLFLFAKLFSVNPSSPNLVLSYSEAARIVLEQAHQITTTKPDSESLPLLTALSRVLAEPIVADRDQPPFPRSARDGFACRTADLGDGSPLKIIGQLRAGEIWKGEPLAPGQTIEIMTGAPVPEGADCVVMIEHVLVRERAIFPSLDRTWSSGENIVPRASEAQSGAIIVPPGTLLGPQQIAAAAACGYGSIPVHLKPRVAILATGDELVPINETPQAHQIRNSNSYSIAAQVLRTGGEPVILPITPDRLPETEQAIRKALECDLLILSGGVSMGQYDFVEQALSNLQAEFFFTGARIQPGKPIVFGQVPTGDTHRYFFGLPGNPISTLVTFALFAAPILRALCGQSTQTLAPTFQEARLNAPVKVKPGLTRFLPANIESRIEGAAVTQRKWQGSGDLTAAAATNCFLVVPEETPTLESGSRVSILML
jgi:molybdopterin molybdotransferase